MKVIQINAVYGIGSTGVIVKKLEKLLLDNGESSAVAYQLADGEPSCGYKVGNPFDWKMHALFTRILGKQAYFSKKATAKLIEWLKEEKPDIVHLHNVHSNFINFNALCKYLSKNDIKTVITMHDCWYFTGKCTHYSRFDCNRWQSKCGSCPQKRYEVKSWLFDRSSFVLKDKTKRLNKIKKLYLIGCSEWICKEAEKSLLKPLEIRKIYNGIDTELFCPHESSFRKDYNLQNDFLILGDSNKWLDEKNRNVFNAVVKSLKDNEKLVLFACSKKAVRKANKYKNVICIPFISDKNKIADLFASVDVFINLTFADTLPTVNMEALASGTPVITYDSCGSPELVEEGVTGYVVPKLNEGKLLKAIDKIKEGKIFREKCREIAVNRFNGEENFNKYLSFYKEIVGE